MNFFGPPRVPRRPMNLPGSSSFDGILSDDDIARLARQFQQQNGEGLAFINPREAQMLQRAGGSGSPVPGTGGLGPMGGPIRSYKVADEMNPLYKGRPGYGGGGTEGATILGVGGDDSGDHLENINLYQSVKVTSH